jgi:hypothetical protein
VEVHCADGATEHRTRRIEGKEGDAIVTFQRRHFVKESLPHMLSSDTSTELHFSNDVYTKVDGVPAVWRGHPLVFFERVRRVQPPGRVS